MSEIRKVRKVVSADNLLPNDRIVVRTPDVGLLPQFEIIREEKIEVKRFYLESLDFEDVQLAGPFYTSDDIEYFELNVPETSLSIPAREFISYLGAIYPDYIRPDDEWDENK